MTFSSKSRCCLLVSACFGLLLGCDGRSVPIPMKASMPPGPEPVSSKWFTELPIGSDFNQPHVLAADDRYFMPKIMGSGGALLDFDGDGLLDVLLVGGQWSDGGQPSQMSHQLFRQDSAGKFIDVSSAAGLGATSGYGVGVAVGDIDNDGDLDIYMTGYGGDRLWGNQGDGTFAEWSESLDAINRRWGTAAAFFDYDRDGWLDLCVVTYLDYFPGSRCDDGSGRPDYCGPKSFSGTVTRLYRNLGGDCRHATAFRDVSVAVGLSARPGPGLGVCCRDFDGDGRPDIFVANDMSPNSLWMQQPDGTFREEGALRGVAANGFGQSVASMGVTCGDFDGDEHDDLFVTTLSGETCLFLRGGADAQFADATAGSGLGPLSLPFTGFGVTALDLENDGDLDLVVVNGRVKRAPPLPASRISSFWNDYAEPNQIFLNDARGHFSEASQSGGDFTGRTDVSRALVYGDIDNDGDFDLLVTSCTDNARMFRNDCPKQGNWLMVRAIDPAQNRDAIGARIEAVAGGLRQHREINPSSSYLASNDFRVQFGFGDRGHYDRLTIRWPDGSLEDFPGGDVNRQVVLLRGRGSSGPGVGSP